MSIEVFKKDKYALVKVLNEKLDAQISPSLKAEFTVLGDTFNKMMVDLSACKYCDSSGLSALLMANRICKTGGGKLALLGVNEAVMKLIQISQLDAILTITSTEEDALSKIM